jgi:hypothetical protein
MPSPRLCWQRQDRSGGLHISITYAALSNSMLPASSYRPARPAGTPCQQPWLANANIWRWIGERRRANGAPRVNCVDVMLCRLPHAPARLNRIGMELRWAGILSLEGGRAWHRRSITWTKTVPIYSILYELGECPCVATEPYNNTITYVHMCVILLWEKCFGIHLWSNPYINLVILI